MARVIVTAPLRGEFPLAAGEFEIAAGSVFELVRELESRSPGLAEFIEAKVSVAVDGELVSDWSTSLTRSSEVMLVPHIAGGWDRYAPTPPPSLRGAEPRGNPERCAQWPWIASLRSQ